MNRIPIALLFLASLFLNNCVDTRPSKRDKVRKLTPAEQKELQKLLLKAPPRPKFPLEATLSIWRNGRLIPALHLYGVDISPVPAKRGEKLTITYYFKPLIKFRYNWGIFLHIEAERADIYFLNKDHQPAKGLYPSVNWKVGQIFKSPYTFTLPADFPGKKLYIYSGLWRPGVRMIVPRKIPNDGRNRILIATIPVEGKEPVRPVYIAHFITTPPKIDGRLSDPIWKQIPTTGPWPTYYNRPAKFKTEAKLAWDKKFLYVAITCEDDDIWGNYTKRDQPLFREEVVEFFIDANRNFRDYIELQVSPRGVVFDSFFPRYRWPKPWGQLQYDSGITVKVSIQGTLNNPNDRDHSWTVEFKLPFSRLGPAFNIPPKDGDEWLINFYRIEKSRISGSEALAWSPVALSNRGGDFHNIAKFGTLRFSTEPPIPPAELGDPTPTPPPPPPIPSLGKRPPAPVPPPTPATQPALKLPLPTTKPAATPPTTSTGKKDTPSTMPAPASLPNSPARR